MLTMHKSNFPSSFFGGCFIIRKFTDTDNTHRHADIAENGGKLPNCIFCNISVDNGFDVEWENDEFIVFADYRPAAQYHFLVVPKTHIANVKTLQKEDASRVMRMVGIGHSILDKYDVPSTSRRLGFHIPPFYSVDHLHLHVQGLPYKSKLYQAKYHIATGSQSSNKGFSWFVEASQAIRILEQGRQIGILPC
ncbi:HIT-like protein [Abortiporus biennis]|nr:HIT-like protein [Abortiporus biennis]